ncbi:MAG: hypothetical protein ACRD23_18195 [Terriglobales bacterium]
MPKQRSTAQKLTSAEEEMVELLRNLLIVQLGAVKVPQDKIRKIASCGINRVNDVLKHVPKSNRQRNEGTA